MPRTTLVRAFCLSHPANAMSGSHEGGAWSLSPAPLSPLPMAVSPSASLSLLPLATRGTSAARRGLALAGCTLDVAAGLSARGGTDGTISRVGGEAAGKTDFAVGGEGAVGADGLCTTKSSARVSSSSHSSSSITAQFTVSSSAMNPFQKDFKKLLFDTKCWIQRTPELCGWRKVIKKVHWPVQHRLRCASLGSKT